MFDFAIAISVFTHLLPSVLERYVLEASRVVAPCGTFVSTFFLLNDEGRRLLAAGKAKVAFRSSGATHWVVEPNMSESAVAYDEAYVRDLFATNGRNSSP